MKKIKKSLAVALAATMLCSGLSAMPMQAVAAEISVQSVSEMDVNFAYYINEDGGAYITSYSGDVTELIIPETIGENTVKGISSLNSDYSGYNVIEKIVIPKTVEKITASSFSDCKSLKEIVVDENNSNYTSENGVLFNKDKSTLVYYPVAKAETDYEIPVGVLNVEGSAFKNCKYIKNVTVPESVTEIEGYVFSDCLSLEKITLSPNITAINEFTFEGCKKLENVIIPDGVTVIGNSAFYDCDSLTNMVIPASVTSVEYRAFASCANLADISIPDSVTKVGKNAFLDTRWINNQPVGVVYAGKTAIAYKGDDGIGKMPENTSVEIKDGTLSITEGAFEACKNLISITIPDSVTYVGNNAFSNCTKLAEVKLPTSLKNIEFNTFYNCKSLSSIVIPDGVESIGQNAFSGCKALEEVIIPASVTNVESYAFASVPWYENQPDGMIYLGSVAYGYKGEVPEDCSIEVQDGTKTTGNAAFYKQSNLEEIIIPESVTSIRTLAFGDCTALKQINLPEGITVIETGTFQGCTSLTEVVIPKNVTIINASAFQDCSSLTAVTIPNGVEQIGMKAFVSCVNLKSVTIPKSVTMIQGSFGLYFEKGQGYLKVEDFTIYGYAGTEAELFANRNEFNFVVLEEEKGDINDDGVVDVKDVTALQMHLANYDVEVNEQTLDVNENTVIDVTDVTVLQMLLAGYEV